MHPLDNVIWKGLNSAQAHLGQSHKQASIFLRDVSILGGFSGPSPERYESLAFLADPGQRVGLFLDEPPQPPASKMDSGKFRAAAANGPQRRG